MRERTEQREFMFLSQYATKSAESRGRQREEPKCPMRTDFQRDRDRIIYSKAFLRLKNKTQVFFSPEGDHFRTRLTHTLDVAQIARSTARALDLNEDLAEAIALGHDLGHTPFGHSGEAVLNRLNPCGFEHNVQSLRVVDVLEKNGKGLNLTYEVRDGILNHKKSGNPSTPEGKVVSIADRIAYLNHDIEDAITAGLLRADELPRETLILGRSSSERINNMITSIVSESAGRPTVKMSDEFAAATDILRDFMFERVYRTRMAKGEEDKADRMLCALYDYFMRREDKLPPFYVSLLERFPKETVVCDYLSGMTDRYAVYVFESLFVPASFMPR